MAEEQWKDIDKAPGYKVSDLGRVRGLFGVMAPFRHESGYVQYSLTVGARLAGFRAHRLVAEAFIPNPGNKSQVHHLDGRRDNNVAANLCWVTPSENCRERSRPSSQRGRGVIQLTMNGDFVREWDSASQASRAVGAQRSIITNCCRGTTRNRSSGGFRWVYTDDYYPADPAEVWKVLVYHRVRCEVSSQGRARSCAHGKITRGSMVGGYMQLRLRENETVALHRLVAMAFCPRRGPDRNYVNHKDLDKTNNAASNLEWVTQSENVQHAHDAARRAETKKAADRAAAREADAHIEVPLAELAAGPAPSSPSVHCAAPEPAASHGPAASEDPPTVEEMNAYIDSLLDDWAQ